MCLVCRLLQPQHVEQAITSAIKIICCIQLAFYFHILTTMRGQKHIISIIFGFSFKTLLLYFLFDISYNSSHLRTNSITVVYLPFLKTKTGSTRCKQTLEVWWRRRKTLHIIGIEQVQTGSEQFRHVKHSRSQRRRNGTETRLRRSCQCEHLRLIAREKILLNGDVPRRNGNVACESTLIRRSIYVICIPDVKGKNTYTLF